MSILSPNPHILYREVQHTEHQQQLPSSPGSITFGFVADWSRSSEYKKRAKRELRTYAAAAFWGKQPSLEMVEMVPIENNEHFDQILTQAQQDGTPVVVDWMATWCRKCIYLKPKLEKLAAEYDAKLKFYYVDVNKVPQVLVKRGNISKMPTIQVWKDGEMKGEVIGGHKAWLVIEEVREMIKPFL